jgi:AcrR family transcriptional regulator
MPRPKILSDRDVLGIAHRLIHQAGPDALTFSALARACGLSASTLVQRFGGKTELVRSALLHAWDRLDERTEELAARLPMTPDGAVEMLVALSGDYGGIDAYADGLLVLREDFRDPVLRARGAVWKQSLTAALDARFAATAGAPEEIGSLMASQWQGSLIWWGFDPQGGVQTFVENGLRTLVAAVLAGEARNPPKG